MPPRQIWSICHLEEILKVSHLDEIAITLGLKEYDKLEEIVVLCDAAALPLRLHRRIRAEYR